MNEEVIKQKLTPEQYKVLCQKGTERPFTGKRYCINSVCLDLKNTTK